jgi:hypothetical protein
MTDLEASLFPSMSLAAPAGPHLGLPCAIPPAAIAAAWASPDPDDEDDEDEDEEDRGKDDGSIEPDDDEGSDDEDDEDDEEEWQVRGDGGLARPRWCCGASSRRRARRSARSGAASLRSGPRSRHTSLSRRPPPAPGSRPDGSR